MDYIEELLRDFTFEEILELCGWDLEDLLKLLISEEIIQLPPNLVQRYIDDYRLSDEDEEERAAQIDKAL